MKFESSDAAICLDNSALDVCQFIETLNSSGGINLTTFPAVKSCANKARHSIEEEPTNNPKIDPVLEDTGEDKCALVEAMLIDTQYVTKSA